MLYSFQRRDDIFSSVVRPSRWYFSRASLRIGSLAFTRKDTANEESFIDDGVIVVLTDSTMLIFAGGVAVMGHRNSSSRLGGEVDRRTVPDLEFILMIC